MNPLATEALLTEAKPDKTNPIYGVIALLGVLMLFGGYVWAIHLSFQMVFGLDLSVIQTVALFLLALGLEVPSVFIAKVLLRGR